MANLPVNFVDTANDRFPQARDFLRNWKSEARDDFSFVSGNQWLDVDKALLQEQRRPTVTFNYCEKMIDAVAGAEVSNRQEVSYKPREVSDAGLSDLWNNAAKAERDACNAEDEETDAFRDAMICGLGCTYTGMNYDDNLDGNVCITRIDPGEMSYDPAARKKGLTDRRYNFRTWWVDKNEAKREWPNSFAYSEDAADMSTGVITRNHRYEDEETDAVDMHKDHVQIRHYECFEREAVYRIQSADGIKELSQSEFSAVKKDLDSNNIQYVKQFKKVYYRGFFSGETLLEGGLSPCQRGFTFNFITGKRDRNRNTWYGLTRVMKDPQRWANKWLSQILHIVNSNAKGGIMAEVGAFVDPRKAQDEWAMPESITLLNEGGIEKIKEKTMANYPSGLDRLMEFALSSLPMVTGINLEALGLAGREQANVLEQSRKQAAYGLLAPLFDSLRLYRKVQGKVFLSFIHDYISDGRLVRIGGADSQQYVPLSKAPDAQTYDVFVDDSPTSPDVKDKTWTTLTQILPAMMKSGLPIPPDLLDYTPLPASLALKWKQYITQQEQQKGPSPQQLQQIQEQMQQLQQQAQKLTQENQQLKQQVADKTIEQQQNQLAMQGDLQLKRERMIAELQMQRDKMQGELALQQDKIEGDLIIKEGAANAHSQITRYKTNIDAINKILDQLSKMNEQPLE